MVISHAAQHPVTRAAVVGLAMFLTAATVAPTAEAGIARRFVPQQDFTLSPGIRYQKGTMRTTGWRIQSVRVAKIDTKHPAVKLRSMLSNDLVIRKERPSRIARRNSRPGMLAMVATNGDRSRFGRVDAHAAPHSMHISNGELMVARACTRPTMGLDRNGHARMDDVRVRIVAEIPGNRDPRQINRVNTHRDDDMVVMFTRRFGPSTRTRGGREVVLRMSGTLKPTGDHAARVVRIRNTGDTRLRSGEVVLSVGGRRGKWVRQLRVGQTMNIKTSIVRNVNNRCGGTIRVATGWSSIIEAMGGNFFVARNGRVRAPSGRQYASSVQRHPRTSLGVTADGRVIMVTVDGRRSGYSIGVTLAEMGRLMLSLGATHALNLDGGGSTVMARRFVRTGDFKVTNRPSDGRERVHSQALVAFKVSP